LLYTYYQGHFRHHLPPPSHHHPHRHRVMWYGVHMYRIR
jgi:hypothetical protein